MWRWGLEWQIFSVADTRITWNALTAITGEQDQLIPNYTQYLVNLTMSTAGARIQ